MENDVKVLGAEPQESASKKNKQPSKFNNFWRKQMVSLKRKPQRISFWLFMITLVFYLLVLGNFSETQENTGYYVTWVGLLVFVNVLCSVLIIVLHMNSFPKHPKYGSKTVKSHEFAKGITVNFNTLMMALLIVFAIVMIVCDVFYCTKMHDYYNLLYTPEYIAGTGMSGATLEAYQRTANLILRTINYSIAHAVLIGVSMICTCLTYVFGTLFVKVDTSIEVESSSENMGHIDLAEDE